MKCIVILLLFNVILIANNMHASYEQLESWVINAGKKIETVDNIPVIGKLTNLLPIAMAATCLQRCPGQTMIVFAGLCLYAIARNRSVYLPLRKLITRNNAQEKEETIQFDETLFDFEDNNQNNDEYEADNDVTADEQIFQKTALL